MTPEIREFLMQPAALIITKSDLRSTVHRQPPSTISASSSSIATASSRANCASSAFSPPPPIRRIPTTFRSCAKKLARVVAASGFSPTGHSGKALIAILEGFPRDELFQIDADTLENMAQGILRLEERPRTRLFVRRDKFDRFVSAFVFIPRDRFDSDVRRKVGDLLAEAFDGEVASFAPSFGEGTLVRVHFIIQATPPDMSANPISPSSNGRSSRRCATGTTGWSVPSSRPARMPA